MKKTKPILTTIICISILLSQMLMPQTVYGDGVNPVVQKAGEVVSRGISGLIMTVNDVVVDNLLNKYNITIKGMLEQDENSNELTTVRIENKKVKTLFSSVVSVWYPKLVMITIIVFLIGFVYIGVLTLFSTSSSKRAEYMQRLITWATGLLMLFAFSYIMVYLIEINNGLSKAFINIGMQQVPVNSPAPAPASNPSIVNVLPDGTKVNALDLINKFRKEGTGDFTLTNGKTGTDKKEVTVKVKDKGTFSIWENWDGSDGDTFFSVDGGSGKYGKIDYTILEGLIRQGGNPCDTSFGESSEQIGNEWVYYDRYYNVEIGDYSIDIVLKAKSMVEGDAGNLREVQKQGAGAYEIKENDTFGVILCGGLDKMYQSNIGTALELYENKTAFTGSLGWGVEPEDDFLKALYNLYYKENGGKNQQNVGYDVLYTVGIIQTLLLIFVYFIRVFMISFLILVFPIIISVYCLDKLNDNKSAVFSNWFKEFVNNVFTNSVHALSYGLIFSLIFSGNNYHPLIKIIALCFIIPSGRILRKIFELEGMGAASSVAGVGAIVAGAAVGAKAIDITKGTVGKFSGGGGSGKGGPGGSGGGSGGDSDGGSGTNRWAAAGGFAKKFIGGAGVIGGTLAGGTSGVIGRAALGMSGKEIVEGGAFGALAGGAAGGLAGKAAGYGADKAINAAGYGAGVAKNKFASRAQRGTASANTSEGGMPGVINGADYAGQNMRVVTTPTAQQYFDESGNMVMETPGDYSAVLQNGEPASHYINFDDNGTINDIGVDYQRVSQMVDADMEPEISHHTASINATAERYGLHEVMNANTDLTDTGTYNHVMRQVQEKYGDNMARLGAEQEINEIRENHQNLNARREQLTQQRSRSFMNVIPSIRSSPALRGNVQRINFNTSNSEFI